MKTADANSSNTPKLTEQQYFEERRLLLEARQRGYQRADQMIVGGATGALVLSITFLRNLGSAAGLLASGWLVSAWILLLVTLLLNREKGGTAGRESTPGRLRTYLVISIFHGLALPSDRQSCSFDYWITV